MCVAPSGLYVKDGTDYLLQEHTYFWDTVLCKYRLGSSMTDAEYAALHADARYSAMFTDGGAGNTTQYTVDVNNGSNPANTATTTATKPQPSIFDNIQSLLTPSQPQSKKTSALVIILIVAAIGVASFFLYKKLKSN